MPGKVEAFQIVVFLFALRRQLHAVNTSATEQNDANKQLERCERKKGEGCDDNKQQGLQEVAVGRVEPGKEGKCGVNQPHKHTRQWQWREANSSAHDLHSVYLHAAGRRRGIDGQVLVHGVGKFGVELRLNVVELGDKSVFGPVYNELADEKQKSQLKPAPDPRR